MNSNSRFPMDKPEALAVIRSILSSAQMPLMVGALNKVFKEKTGFDIPLYGYKSLRDFLHSAQDTVEITGSFPFEKIVLASKTNSQDVLDPVKSQIKPKRRSFLETLRNSPRKEEVTKRVIPQRNSFKQEKETPESRNFMEHMEHNNSIELKESVDSRESRGSGVTKESGQSDDARESREFDVSKESRESGDSREFRGFDVSKEFNESNASREFSDPVDSSELRDSNSVNEISPKSPPKVYTANLNSLYRMYSPPQYKEKLNEKAKAESSPSTPKETRKSTLADRLRATFVPTAASLTEPTPLPRPKSVPKAAGLPEPEPIPEPTSLRTPDSLPKPTSPPTASSPTSASLSTSESPRTRESFPTPESDLLPRSLPKQEVSSTLLKSMVVYEEIPLLNVRHHAAEEDYVEITPCWIQNPTMFYFRFRKFQAQYQNMAKKLDKFYSFYEDVIPNIPEHLVRPGRLCVVPRTTHGVQKWCRGEIRRLKNESEVQVFLLDIGQIIIYNRSELKIFHKKLLELPKQTVRGYLANIKPIGSSPQWPYNASKRFRDLALNKDLIGGVVDHDSSGPADGGRLGLVLTNTLTRNEIHINDTLVSEGLARFFMKNEFSEVWCTPGVPVTFDKKNFIQRIIANSHKNALECAQEKVKSGEGTSKQPKNQKNQKNSNKKKKPLRGRRDLPRA